MGFLVKSHHKHFHRRVGFLYVLYKQQFGLTESLKMPLSSGDSSTGKNKSVRKAVCFLKLCPFCLRSVEMVDMSVQKVLSSFHSQISL